MPTLRTVKLCFYAFTVAQIITIFGDRLHQFAVVGMIGRTEPGSSVELLQFALFAQLPLLLAPVLGSLIDRSNKVWVLIVVDFVRGLIVFAIPPLFMAMNNLYAFYVPVFFLSLGNLLFVPAKSAIIPEVFSSLKLLKINSILWGFGVVGTLAGFLIGGWLFDYVSWKWGFYADGISYVASVFFLLPLLILYRMRTPSADAAAGAASAARTGLLDTLRSIREGVALIKVNPAVAFALVVQTVAFATLGALYVVGIARIQSVLPPDKAIYLSVVASAGTVGLLAGAGLTIVARARLSPQRIIAHSTLLLAAAWVGVARVENLLPMTLWALAMGLAISPAIVLTETLLQEQTPVEFRGRVFSTREVLTRASFLLLSLAGTSASAVISKSVIMIAFGLFLAITGVLLERKNFLNV